MRKLCKATGVDFSNHTYSTYLAAASKTLHDSLVPNIRTMLGSGLVWFFSAKIATKYISSNHMGK